jgi:hypothetical protein
MTRLLRPDELRTIEVSATTLSRARDPRLVQAARHLTALLGHVRAIEERAARDREERDADRPRTFEERARDEGLLVRDIGHITGVSPEE